MDSGRIFNYVGVLKSCIAEKDTKEALEALKYVENQIKEILIGKYFSFMDECIDFMRVVDKINCPIKEGVCATAASTEDKVNHPSHYTWLKDLCGIEVIDITRHMDFNLGNAVKYLLRAGHKSEEGYSDKEKTAEDLKKAVWYIQDTIKTLENEQIQSRTH